MRVILTEKVPFLGNVGEMVTVSSGHARNYLLPRKLAVVADESNKKQLEDNQRRLTKKVNEQKSEAEAIKSKIEGIQVEIFKKVGGTGKLFGSVTNTDLAKELEAQGVSVERRIIAIDTPIKNLGTYDIAVKLFQDVEAKFQVKVSIDPKQAEEMKKKQIAAEKRAEERKAAKAAELLEGSEKGEEGAESSEETSPKNTEETENTEN